MHRDDILLTIETTYCNMDVAIIWGPNQEEPTDTVSVNSLNEPHVGRIYSWETFTVLEQSDHL